MAVLVAGDWHLAPGSPALHARLACAFLARARAEGATVVLNGDVFDALFAGAERCRRAHPRVAAAIEALARDGKLLRLRGNHDPDAGGAQAILAVPGLGRVLVAHGHEADPVHAGPLGRAGDAVARRFGRWALVRGAAWLAEAGARTVAEEWMAACFRRRCLALVRREGCAWGIFGHVHVPYLAPPDPYVNAGGLTVDRLTYVALERSGPHLRVLRPRDLPGGDGIAAEMG